MCGCVSLHQDKIALTAKVDAYHPQAMHEDYDDGGWATYDAVVFQILSPSEWKGTNLTILCHPEDPNVTFKTVGDVFQFEIREDYLGKRDGSLFDGAIQIVKKIEQTSGVDRLKAPPQK